jgi:spore coat polysaccharide biosynthesis protein SpsF
LEFDKINAGALELADYFTAPRSNASGNLIFGQMKLAIVIQARVGSTRLPEKMLRPFLYGRTIPELIIDRLLTAFDPGQVILATSVSNADDPLARMAEAKGVHVVRGDENDVLSRFVLASERYGLTHVVRICADNPFIRLDGIEELIRVASEHNWEDDYLTFCYHDQLPVMRGHVGMYAELIRSSALKNLFDSNHDAFFREHVTNGIYAQPEKYALRYIEMPKALAQDKGLRLTVDTEGDFLLLSELAQSLQLAAPNQTYADQSIDVVLAAVNTHPTARASMLETIQMNVK